MENENISRIAGILADAIGVDEKDVIVRQNVRGETYELDAIIDIGLYTFVVEWKKDNRAAHVLNAIRQVMKYAYDLSGSPIPLIVNPYMGKIGQSLCEEKSVSWLDLSGNVDITASGLRIHIEGKPNLYKKTERTVNVFAPKSSRIIRWLLNFPDKVISQRDLAHEIDMDEGFVSRLVKQLEKDDYIVRDLFSNKLKPHDPGLLLKIWHDKYEFKRHVIIKGHIASKSGDALIRKLSDFFSQASIEYAATGLAAAWQMSHFAGFRLATMYLKEMPESSILESLGFRNEKRGSNVWFVIPNDEGVFHYSELRDGIQCVSPVQVYLDLKGHPERSEEAARQLKRDYLNRGSNDS